MYFKLNWLNLHFWQDIARFYHPKFFQLSTICHFPLTDPAKVPGVHAGNCLHRT